MRRTLDHPVTGLNATVTIDREGDRGEPLILKATGASPLVYDGNTAPEEPHVFSARLRLTTMTGSEILHSEIIEPVNPYHRSRLCDGPCSDFRFGRRADV